MNYDLFMPTVVAEGTRIADRTSGPVRRSRAVTDGAAADRPPRNSASEPMTTEEVENAVAAFNDVFEQANVGVRYRVDQGTGDLVISLVDRDTDEVVRQVPPDQILHMRQRLEELLGLIFDTTV